jgi:class 3 adenylate cyclase/tetratricopeptide (TPR) repeat protein
MASPVTKPNFRPYVPLLVRQWLDLPEPDARHRIIDGSIVFADISGFTKLSERLDRIGPEGAERVTEVIGNAFNRLLSPAYAYDGTLVKFGGDALLLFYRGADHELRAASAALEMRQALRATGPIDTPAGKVILRMSQGVHTGAFHFFLVGSSFRELVVAGRASTHVHHVEGAANSGQIIVSDATARAVPDKNLGPVRGPGRLLRGSLLPLPGLTQEAYDVEHDLSPFVPSALRELIRRGAVVSEHRPVANAFIRFSGVDELLAVDPDTVTDAFSELIDDIQAAAEPRHIAVLSTDFYPDGVKIHLSAGAPVSTGEDEENMLLAVREVIDKRRPLPLHIGVTRGPVFAGDVGTMFRRGYTVMGDQVNLAARLMAKATPNQVLATDEVLRGSRTIFETTALEPFYVKGKKRPVTAFSVGEPEGARVEASRNLPFVGRGDELRFLHELWEKSTLGAASPVLIDGGTGFGKSRLAAEFADSLDAGQVYRVVCRRYRASSPYFASTLLLGAILGIDRDMGDGRAERLTDLVGSLAPDLVPYLSLIGTALGIDIRESPEVAALAQEFRKLRLEESIVALLRERLAAPTLMWVDDAQWLDEASRDLFAAMTGAGQPWLLCLSGRAISELNEDLDAARLVLGPLSDHEATLLVHRCTDETPLPTHLSRAIVERAAGNPMFISQLIAASGSTDVAALPESIEGVITARIDRLLPDDRNVLRRLSVLGTGFKPEYASVVLNESASDATLKRLTDFLDFQPEWIQFGSSLVHQAAYAGLPYRLRRELHGKVAESIERAQGGAALLSVHYSAAARWSKAWEYARLAGEHSKRIYANLEAARFFEQALEAARYLGTPTGHRIDVLTSLGEVRYAAGLYDEAGSAFRRARRLADHPVVIASLSLKEAMVAHKKGHLTQALRWTTKGRRVLEGVETNEAMAQRAELTVWAGGMRYAQGRYDDAIKAYEQAIEEAQLAGNQKALAHAYHLHDAARVWSGQASDNDYSWRALAIYEELGDLEQEALVVGNLAAFAYLDGRWKAAVDLYERSRETHLKTGNPVEAARAEENLGELLCDRGNLDEAEEVLRSALRVWKAADNPAETAFVQCQLGRVASRAGRYADAASLLTEARRGFANIGARYDALDVQTRIIENLVYQGLGEKALNDINETMEQADVFGEGIHRNRLRLMLGYALTQAGRPAEGLTHVERALDDARDRGALNEVALGLEARARVRRLLGVDDWAEGLDETWSIQTALGIISIPRVPLHQR